MDINDDNAMKDNFNVDISKPTIDIQWKGTIGVGDFMWGLNVAYNLSHRYDKLVNFGIHWYHNDDYLHHPKDPETIIERLEYIAEYYDESSGGVNVLHLFNSTDDQLHRQRYRGLDLNPTPFNSVNYWQFNANCVNSAIKKQSDNIGRITETVPTVVVWTPFENKDPPHGWKSIVSPTQWQRIINTLEQQYNVVQLTYRDSIKYALQQIASCKFVVCYDGMWHYIARNLHKPMIVFSRNNLTLFHTPNATMVRENFVEFVDQIETNLPLMEANAEQYRSDVQSIINRTVQT